MSAGGSGVYVANWLAAPHGADEDAEVLALCGAERLLGTCYFGARGNLVVLEREPLDAGKVADAIFKSQWGWRIALGRSEVVRALATREVTRPLVEREQVWYGVAAEGATRELVRSDVRSACEADLSALIDAALQLNQSDLAVEPRRVNKSWLESMLRRRIRDKSTKVIGPPGHVVSKLDLGSRGPHGLVLEGVFTAPESRGSGLAAGLVATVIANEGATLPIVCLHVAASNSTARRVYERAGMRELAHCGLLLRG